MTTHVLLTPWPISSGLFTYCGKPAAECGDDHVSNKPELIDCEGCKQAMRIAFENLEKWVPGLT